MGKIFNICISVIIALIAAQLVLLPIAALHYSNAGSHLPEAISGIIVLSDIVIAFFAGRYVFRKLFRYFSEK